MPDVLAIARQGVSDLVDPWLGGRACLRIKAVRPKRNVVA